MKSTVSNIPTADEIAEMADRGEDISRFFTNTETMKYPSQRVQIDFPVEMVVEPVGKAVRSEVDQLMRL